MLKAEKQINVAEKFVVPKWMYIVLLFYAIQGSINNYVRLYILELGGGAVKLSLALSTYSLAIIPAAYIAGIIADNITQRKIILTIGGVGQILIIILLARLESINMIVVCYAIYSFISNFSPVLFSLLMIETLRKQFWGKGRDAILRNMILGQVLGLAVNQLVLVKYELKTVALIPIILSAIMVTLNMALVKDPDFTLERKLVTMNQESLVSRLGQVPVMILKPPRLSDFVMVFRGLRNILTRELPLIIVSMNLFFFGTNLFTTSYTPYLKSLGLTNFMMTSLDLVLALIEAVVIRNQFSDISRKGDPAVAVEFFTLRALAFLFAAIVSLSVGAKNIPIATAILYVPIGLSYSNLVIGVHKMLYDILPQTQEGRTLGVYSSLNNFMIFIGSLISGSISELYGYSITFLISSIALFTSASLFEWHYKPKRLWAEEE